jgi:dienelactone hydrolase
MKSWFLAALGVVLIVAGSLLASLIQTSGGIRVEDVRFAGGTGTLSGLLYVPPNATAAAPAPGVIAIHGLINSREMQDGFAIEFARRGYVVLALDMTGHGYSTPPMTMPELGGADALRWLRTLPFVDRNNIGLEGHSLGGMAVMSAVKALPDAYRAAILIGSTTGTPAVATPSFPRNIAFILGAYDEFTPLMWGTKSFYDPVSKRQALLARDIGASDKLKAAFGTHDAVVPGKIYGDISAGTGRELYLPHVTHPQEHFAAVSIGQAMNWFGKTLHGGTPRSDDDQVWYWKEIGTGVAFAGFVLLLLGAFDALLQLPAFAPLRHPSTPSRERRDGRWWASFWLSVLVPGLVFLPAMIVAQLAIPPLAAFPQVYTNQVLVWALMTAAVLFVIRRLSRGGSENFSTNWLLSGAIAIGTVVVGYVSLLVVDRIFHTDFRLWVLALKLLSPWQFKALLIYLIPFGVYFLVSLHALHSDLAVKSDSALRQYATAIVAMAGGIALFLAADYLPMLTSDHLLVAMDPLHPIIGIQFVPILAIVALISTFTYRRTNSYVPGALICTLFVTWYVTAGTATMF